MIDIENFNGNAEKEDFSELFNTSRVQEISLRYSIPWFSRDKKWIWRARIEYKKGDLSGNKSFPVTIIR